MDLKTHSTVRSVGVDVNIDDDGIIRGNTRITIIPPNNDKTRVPDRTEYACCKLTWCVFLKPQDVELS